MAIKSIDSGVCRAGCQLCFEACPFDVITSDPSTGKAVVTYSTDCYDRCNDCAGVCPVGAIECA